MFNRMLKKQLGQFLTKNSSYILQGFERYASGKNVTDPFAGNGDLLEWAKRHGAGSIKGFDIDNKYIDDKHIFYNDSLLSKKSYHFVITNPPYLNINKASAETKNKYLNKHYFEDLYQISLSSILDSEEGIVIVPINFLSAGNSRKIRDIFFAKFKITDLNYFTQPVFEDTTYNVISFYYKKHSNALSGKMNINVHIFPETIHTQIELNKNFGWSIGGEFVSMIKGYGNNLLIERLQEKDLKFDGDGWVNARVAYNHTKNIQEIKIPKRIYEAARNNIILLKAIDSGTKKGRIAFEDLRRYGVSCLVSKESSRHMVQLIFKRNISIEEQEKLIGLFNSEINRLRNKYFSLFLTNYRDNDRKRISFDFVYKFVNFLYFNKIQKTESVLL